MNPFVADPHWGTWIIAYFFLGGIAAGAYAIGTLATLFGTETDRRTLRLADYVAFPLVCICGILLVIDLNRPERFWHMLIQSETYRPMFKWWSPMSVGSWGLALFGFFSGCSFLGVLIEDRWLGSDVLRDRVRRLRQSVWAKLFAICGAATAFFVGSYTGVLLSASNQPNWADTTWLGPLFLASAASTGIAVLVLAGRWVARDVSAEVLEKLERLDLWAIALELVLLALWAGTIDAASRRGFVLWPGVLIPLFVVPIGLLVPLAVFRFARKQGVGLVPVLVLLGGLALRIAAVGLPEPLRMARLLP